MLPSHGVYSASSPASFANKSADLIQLLDLVLCECEFHCRDIVLKLVGAFRANYDRGYRRLCLVLGCRALRCERNDKTQLFRSVFIKDLPCVPATI
jgi:hypothetical protein